MFLGTGTSSKPVCDDSWDLKDGGVVCKELGYHGIVRVTKESSFGQVSSSFAADNVGCAGTENHLVNCSYSRHDDCSGGEGAGVVCDTRTRQEIDSEQQIINSCFEEGVSYHYGEYIDFDVVDTSLQCQQHCRNHIDCNYFTFYAANHKCYRSEEESLYGPAVSI